MVCFGPLRNTWLRLIRTHPCGRRYSDSKKQRRVNQKLDSKGLPEIYSSASSTLTQQSFHGCTWKKSFIVRQKDLFDLLIVNATLAQLVSVLVIQQLRISCYAVSAMMKTFLCCSDADCDSGHNCRSGTIAYSCYSAHIIRLAHLQCESPLFRSPRLSSVCPASDLEN